jgi:hypothetical protein
MQSTRNCGSCDPGDEQPPPRGDCFCLTLLLVGVTWPRALPPAPVVSYTTFSPLPTYLHPPLNSRIWGRWEGVVGGLFLWPNPSGCPVPGVARHHAPWSADFPRQRDAAAVIRPAWGGFMLPQTGAIRALAQAVDAPVCDTHCKYLKDS